MITEYIIIWDKSHDRLRQHTKKQRHYFANKGPSSQSYGFSSSHVWSESWTIKKAEHRSIDAFELWCRIRRLRVPRTARRSKPVNPKGNQSWIFIRVMGVEAEAPILWPPDAKNWLTGKDPNSGKDWRWEEKGTTEDEMVGWHHRLNGHEFEQALGVDDWQGSLAWCSPWGCKESDTTERLNWTYKEPINDDLCLQIQTSDQCWSIQPKEKRVHTLTMSTRKGLWTYYPSPSVIIKLYVKFWLRYGAQLFGQTLVWILLWKVFFDMINVYKHLTLSKADYL